MLSAGRTRSVPALRDSSARQSKLSETAVRAAVMSAGSLALRRCSQDVSRAAEMAEWESSDGRAGVKG